MGRGRLEAAEEDTDQGFSDRPVGGTMQPCPLAKRAADPDRQDWIEIVLLDNFETPMAGEKYRVEVTDGTVREGTLDGEGRALIEGIDPGSCTVTFPDLDREAA